MSEPEVSIRVTRDQFTVELDLVLDGAVGLIGASGSGKSTVLRALAGLEKGAGVAWPSGAGYLGQVDGLFPHLTARDNVAYMLRAAGASRTDARTAALLLLEELGLGELARATPGRLSGGQRRRVALARALASRRSVYLLDEPFAGLDEEAADAAARFIAARLLDHDAPAVIAGHDIDRLDRICGRVERLERGRIIATELLSAEVARPRAQARAAEPRNTDDKPEDSRGGSR